MITAYPLTFNITLPVLGTIPITGFGVMMMLAFLVGGWIVDRECRQLGFASDYAGDIVMAALFGGIVGAKLWFVALNGTDALFARGGLVWYGGFTGGVIGVILNGWRRRVPVRWTAQLVAPALAAAYAVGRIGCYVVGDDYGIPTTLPWGVKFPQGMPATTAANLRAFNVNIPANVSPDTVLAVHPTQLYEVAIMVCVFAVLWRWRTRARGTGWLFGAYLMLAGTERFLVEFLRAKDDRHLGSMTIAQAASLAGIAVGGVLYAKWSAGGTIAPGRWLERGATPAPAQAQ